MLFAFADITINKQKGSSVYGRIKFVRDGICEITGLESARSGEVIYITLNADFLDSPDFLGNQDKNEFFFMKKKIERVTRVEERFIRALVLNLNIESISAMVLWENRLDKVFLERFLNSLNTKIGYIISKLFLSLKGEIIFTNYCR